MGGTTFLGAKNIGKMEMSSIIKLLVGWLYQDMLFWYLDFNLIMSFTIHLFHIMFHCRQRKCADKKTFYIFFLLWLSGEPHNSLSNVLDTEHNFQIKCFWLICNVCKPEKIKRDSSHNIFYRKCQEFSLSP